MAIIGVGVLYLLAKRRNQILRQIPRQENEEGYPMTMMQVSNTKIIIVFVLDTEKQYSSCVSACFNSKSMYRHGIFVGA
jgi:hypothetical protein